MRFEWDPEKAAANLKKHGISFQDAAIIFGDPLTIAPRRIRQQT
ncbi:MAG: BrnT family toxin [Deltaproteobacteria bacterium]|nr:BrnT family toxin [Deltaproteobacteria bacterium]